MPALTEERQRALPQIEASQPQPGDGRPPTDREAEDEEI